LKRISNGYSLISALVATIIIILGISCVLLVIQNTERLFKRATSFQDFAVAAEILNDKIQDEFSCAGTAVPEKIEGKMPDFPDLYYEISFHQIKENLYEVHIKLFRTDEGKKFTEEFITALHQR